MSATGNRYTVPRNGYDSLKDKEADQDETKEIAVGESVKETQRVTRVRVVGYAPAGGPLKVHRSTCCNVVLNMRDEDVQWPFKGPVSS